MKGKGKTYLYDSIFNMVPQVYLISNEHLYGKPISFKFVSSDNYKCTCIVTNWIKHINFIAANRIKRSMSLSNFETYCSNIKVFVLWHLKSDPWLWKPFFYNYKKRIQYFWNFSVSIYYKQYRADRLILIIISLCVNIYLNCCVICIY
jgi:hypothetical protein